MPDDLLGSASEFDQAKAKLGAWLRDQETAAKALSADELAVYDGRFVAGWLCVFQTADTPQPFHILLSDDFPYVPARVGMTSDEKYLVWPHVESKGLLCLPKDSDAFVDPVKAAAHAIEGALWLVHTCNTDATYVRAELEREFVSYWGWAVRGDKRPILSLLNVANPSPRYVSVWDGKSWILIAEKPDDAERWLKNFGKDDAIHLGTAVFGGLGSPPVPPFPAQSSELMTFLDNYAPDTKRLLDLLPPADGCAIVLTASVDNRQGLVGVSLDAPSMKGFRPNPVLLPKGRALLRARSKYSQQKVERIDGAWVHGRGVNADFSLLKEVCVAILGCGSLGSQVAVRLAQSGVGSLILVDPELLAAANVGRHALGIPQVGKSKSESLAKSIRERFPHMTEVKSLPYSWEDLAGADWQQVTSANLIVSCIGDWAAEGKLNEWQVRNLHGKPVMYGWLDAQGIASHAISLFHPKPCLACILDATGSIRVPEFILPNGGQMETEPACGTAFQPFGALDVAMAETLVSELAISILTGKSDQNRHRVRVTSTARLSELNGSWTDAHKGGRPAGFEGSFEFEREMVARADCPICGGTT